MLLHLLNACSSRIFKRKLDAPSESSRIYRNGETKVKSRGTVTRVLSKPYFYDDFIETPEFLYRAFFTCIRFLVTIMYVTLHGVVILYQLRSITGDVLICFGFLVLMS